MTNEIKTPALQPYLVTIPPAIAAQHNVATIQTVNATSEEAARAYVEECLTEGKAYLLDGRK